MSANNIVTINVSTVNAPAPNQLLNKGALVSVGSTSAANGTLTLLTQLSDLSLRSLNVSSSSWSGGTLTLNLSGPHGFTGSGVVVTLAGATPSSVNGKYAATVVDADTLTVPLANNPGALTGGNVTFGDLSAMATTYFAQNGAQPVYVLELGPDTPAGSVADLAAWLTANPDTVYAFVTPRSFDLADMVTLAGLYEAVSQTIQFFVTTTTGTYAQWAGKSSVAAFVEAPSIPATEFLAAAVCAEVIQAQPSSNNPLRPLTYRYLVAVTPYPTSGNNPLLTLLQNAGINYVATAAEGGLTNSILFRGTTADGKQFNYWYSADWAKINLDLDLANAIITGNNNGLNPLGYNQEGIDTLQAVASNTLGRAITYGLANGTLVSTQYPAAEFRRRLDAREFAGQIVVNAEPFDAYTSSNPSDYAAGRYNGLSAVYVPQLAFEQIVFNLVVTDLING